MRLPGSLAAEGRAPCAGPIAQPLECRFRDRHGNTRLSVPALDAGNRANASQAKHAAHIQRRFEVHRETNRFAYADSFTDGEVNTCGTHVPCDAFGAAL